MGDSRFCIGSSLEEIKLIMHVAVGQAAAAEPPGAQSAQSAAAKEVVEQPRCGSCYSEITRATRGSTRN